MSILKEPGTLISYCTKLLYSFFKLGSALENIDYVNITIG